MASLEAIVVGSGPNGLTAAATLARAGLKTLLLEAQAEIGGAARTRELTEPGFLHDVGGSFLPFGPVSPGLIALDLAEAGLQYCHAPTDSVHLDRDGGCAVLSRYLDRTLAGGEDGPAFVRWAKWRLKLGRRFDELALGPLPLLDVISRLDPLSLMRFAAITASTPGGFGRSQFQTAIGQRVVTDLCLHADVGPEDAFGASLGTVLMLMALSAGFPVARGGAGELSKAIARRFTEAGGLVRTSARVAQVRVAGGRVRGVTLGGGREPGLEIDAPLVLADVSAPKLVRELVGEAHFPRRLVSAMRGFTQGWGTFKMDWALDGPVPWIEAPARESNVVHLGGSLGDLARFTDEVRAGLLPSDPYLLVGQQSVSDPSRAPPGKHVLYAYTHVPAEPEEGAWDGLRDRFADRVEETIETHAPGFRKLVRRRSISAPPDLERENENLTGGDSGGGTARIDNLLFFRPAFPFFSYRMGITGLYLCSAYAHPGAGVHGACGYNAARAALRAA